MERLRTVFEHRAALLRNPPEHAGKATLRVALESDVLGDIPTEFALDLIRRNLPMAAGGATVPPGWGVYEEKMERTLWIEIVLTPIYDRKAWGRFVDDVEAFAQELNRGLQQREILGELVSPTDTHVRAAYRFDLRRQRSLPTRYDRVMV